MDLRVLEGQTSRGLFLNSNFDPSVIGAVGQSSNKAIRDKTGDGPKILENTLIYMKKKT